MMIWVCSAGDDGFIYFFLFLKLILEFIVRNSTSGGFVAASVGRGGGLRGEQKRKLKPPSDDKRGSYCEHKRQRGQEGITVIKLD